MTKIIKTACLLGAICVGVLACNKDKIKIKNYSKEIVGKWTIKGRGWIYTDFNGAEQELFNDYMSSPDIIYYNEFKSDGSWHQTVKYVANNTETNDYSPFGWAVDGENLKFITPHSSEIYQYNITKLNQSELEYTQNSSDTLYQNGVAIGVAKSSFTRLIK